MNDSSEKKNSRYRNIFKNVLYFKYFYEDFWKSILNFRVL